MTQRVSLQVPTAEGHKTLVINVNGAFVQAATQRNLRIELPDEDKSEEEKGDNIVGYLNQSLHRIRDVAANFL